MIRLAKMGENQNQFISLYEGHCYRQAGPTTTPCVEMALRMLDSDTPSSSIPAVGMGKWQAYRWVPSCIWLARSPTAGSELASEE